MDTQFKYLGAFCMTHKQLNINKMKKKIIIFDKCTTNKHFFLRQPVNCTDKRRKKYRITQLVAYTHLIGHTLT